MHIQVRALFIVLLLLFTTHKSSIRVENIIKMLYKCIKEMKNLKVLEIIKNVVTSDPFITIITGLVLYILSQLFMEYIINPRKEYKNLRQRIIYTIKMYCCYYSNPYNVHNESKNARSKEEYDSASLEMRKIGAELAGYIGNLPKKSKEIEKLNNVLNALIGLSNGFYNIDGYNSIKENKKCEDIIKKNLDFE